MRISELLKRVLVVALVTIAILFGATSCSQDDGAACTVEALKYKVVKKTTDVTNKMMTVEIHSPLTADVYIEGNAISQGNLNTNGYNIQVLGDFEIKGNFNGADTTTIFVEGELKVNGNINLNQSEVRCNEFWLNGNMSGQGQVYWCESEWVNGNINNNQPTPILVQNCLISTDNVLTDGAIDYEVVTVPCDYIGRYIDGFFYAEVTTRRNVDGGLSQKVTPACVECGACCGEAHSTTCGDVEVDDERLVGARI